MANLSAKLCFKLLLSENKQIYWHYRLFKLCGCALLFCMQYCKQSQQIVHAIIACHKFYYRPTLVQLISTYVIIPTCCSFSDWLMSKVALVRTCMSSCSCSSNNQPSSVCNKITWSPNISVEHKYACQQVNTVRTSVSSTSDNIL